MVWIGGLVLTAVVTAAIGRIALRMLGEAGAVAAAPPATAPRHANGVQHISPGQSREAGAALGNARTDAP